MRIFFTREAVRIVLKCEESEIVLTRTRYMFREDVRIVLMKEDNMHDFTRK